MANETSRRSTAEFLDTPEAILAYIQAVFEEGDAEQVAVALGNAARAKGFAQDGPTAQSDIASVVRAVKARGLELTVRAA